MSRKFKLFLNLIFACEIADGAKFIFLTRDLLWQVMDIHQIAPNWRRRTAHLHLRAQLWTQVLVNHLLRWPWPIKTSLFIQRARRFPMEALYCPFPTRTGMLSLPGKHSARLTQSKSVKSSLLWSLYCWENIFHVVGYPIINF